MKLVINIPCYNEEKTLDSVLAELPKSIPGIDIIEVQVVDDGSTDRTAEIARKHKCVLIRHKKNQGLGNAFRTGIEVALDRGCDILVNTDADNQYPSKYIAELVKPIIEGRADIVIGNREPWKVIHFSPLKRFFQFFGNMIVRNIAGSDVPDTVSGFRAYSKESLLKLNITTKFSYVLDSIVQASKKGLKIESVKIRTNAPTRNSRLFKNIYEHMWKSGVNILRCYIVYEPFRTFLTLSLLMFVPGLFLSIRFLYYFITSSGAGHIQSLIFAAVLFILSGLMFVLGIIAELLGTNRRLIEETVYLKKKEMYGKR